MVFSHFVRCFVAPDSVLFFFCHFAHRITFLTFAFCFGYVCQKAYIRKAPNHRSAALKTAYKCFSAFLVISFYERILGGIDDVSRFFSILTCPSAWAAFIMPYGLFAVVVAFFPSFLSWASGNVLRIGCFTLFAIALTFLRHFFTWDAVPFLGFLIGNSGKTDAAYWPVLQYLPVYLLGMYFSRNEITRIASWKIGLAIGYVCFFYLVGFLQFNNFFEYAFVKGNPPTAMVILQGMCAPVVIYMVARYVIMFLPFYISRFLNFMGYNLLYFLVSSSIIYFLLRREPWAHSLYGMNAIVLFLVFLYSMYFISTTVVSGDKAGKSVEHLKK